MNLCLCTQSGTWKQMPVKTETPHQGDPPLGKGRTSSRRMSPDMSEPWGENVRRYGHDPWGRKEFVKQDSEFTGHEGEIDQSDSLR